MKQVYRIDNEGYFIEDVIIQDNENIPDDCILIPCPCGFNKPKWENDDWVEGTSKEELEELKNRPIPKTEVELIKEKQEMQDKAILELSTLIGGVK